MTRDRADLLPRVLSALEQQTLDRTRFEIVAIDDGSTDSTPAVLADWQDRLPMRIFRQNHAGLAAAKNLGVLAARSPLLVFLDDDDVAQPDLLEAHLAAHFAYPDPTIAILGYTSLEPAIAALPLMRHVTEVGCQLFSYGWMQRGQVLDHTAFWGGRSSCKRALLVRHGIFNPAFRFGCEDIELGWRLARHGLRVVYEPRAHTVMIRSLTFPQFCARSYRQGRSQYRFARLTEDEAVRAYCEIDAANEAWTQGRRTYAGHLRWTAKLDRLAKSWWEAGLRPNEGVQSIFDDAYRESFKLSRAKGIVDAASSERLAPSGERSCLLEFGIEKPVGVPSF